MDSGTPRYTHREQLRHLGAEKGPLCSAPFLPSRRHKKGVSLSRHLFLSREQQQGEETDRDRRVEHVSRPERPSLIMLAVHSGTKCLREPNVARLRAAIPELCGRIRVFLRSAALTRSLPPL